MSALPCPDWDGPGRPRRPPIGAPRRPDVRLSFALTIFLPEVVNGTPFLRQWRAALVVVAVLAAVMAVLPDVYPGGPLSMRSQGVGAQIAGAVLLVGLVVIAVFVVRPQTRTSRR